MAGRERRLGLPGPAARRGRDRQGGGPDSLAGRGQGHGLLVAEGARAEVGRCPRRDRGPARRQPRGPTGAPSGARAGVRAGRRSGRAEPRQGHGDRGGRSGCGRGGLGRPRVIGRARAAAGVRREIARHMSRGGSRPHGDGGGGVRLLGARRRTDALRSRRRDRRGDGGGARRPSRPERDAGGRRAGPAGAPDLGYASRAPRSGRARGARRGRADRRSARGGGRDDWWRPAARARCPPEDLRGGTFTITDAGRLGGLFATPLLNTPQVAILGVHRVTERPVVRDGEIVARPVGMLSVSFDHRALDGAAASAFLLDVIDRIEGWRLS